MWVTFSPSIKIFAVIYVSRGFLKAHYMWTILATFNFFFIFLGIRVNSQKVYSPVYSIVYTRWTWWLPCNDPYIYHIDHFLSWWLFCTLHPSVLKYVTSALLHPRQENCNTPYWQGSIHSRAQITRSWKKSPFLRHRMPLTLPADWEVQSPLPNLWCYQPLPLAAQIYRRFLLVRQNCSVFSHWSKSRVAVMQEEYFNKLLEQRDGVNVA